MPPRIAIARQWFWFILSGGCPKLRVAEPAGEKPDDDASSGESHEDCDVFCVHAAKIAEKAERVNLSKVTGCLRRRLTPVGKLSVRRICGAG